ncbi:universal stress protein [Rubrivirga sp. S365]|uniref:Universal stress protein n=1 Tax=Rubrivirga litoralis TaxID=3075598 RepID=A0ABU3BNI5_9BACT|nr:MULTISPECIES: universal stress protein [unclassified Rubrivirga]MDT0630849.1 universal stress protein [Rubrivirga sp. F394]MDT7857401.1 universal stress protein [Rubrivirga sp. S365]
MPTPPLVVPTDLSAAAAEALRYALRMSRATGAPVHLLHVVAWPDAGRFEADSEALTAGEEEADEAARAQAALRAVVAEAGAEGEVVLAVRHGNVPAADVLGYVRDVEAGLVVMGTCGRRPRRHVLGSVAGEVVQTAPCDVLLVPHRDEAPFSAAPPRRVLAPVDFSSASRPLALVALRLARDLGAEGVDLVHVLEPLPHPLRWLDETLVDVAPTIRERAEVALHELADDVAAEVPGVPVARYIERGKAARTVARVAEALGDDLILVGPHAERPVFDRLLGSVAEGVARRARCPVLVARRSAAPGPLDAADVDGRSYEAAAPPYA